MKCTLMNKNVSVVDLELDDDTAVIVKVMTSIHLAYLPVGISIRTGNILFDQPTDHHEINMMSPCNTSDGWLRKKWKIVNGRRCLIKAGSYPFMQEPLNEVAATKLHDRLDSQNYVRYSLLWENGIPYSICEDFIHTDWEFVNAVSINRSMKKRSQNSSYKHFLLTCDQLGIQGMKEFLDLIVERVCGMTS